MCGISGTFGISDEDVIGAMNKAITHRGPDDSGIYLDKVGQVALGHRRLAIIDLSSAGHQPMSYNRGRYWITYNGEIYNYKDIRAELENMGYSFISDADTEVILAAYVKWGESCVKRLRGMFAFAIYDRGTGDNSESSVNLSDRRQIFLARDRFGIKPLYYVRNNGVFLFASEIKALLASGLISRQVDYQAVWDYLSLGSIPQPRTILADVKALLPAHVMKVNSCGEIKISRYWDIAADAARSFPEVSSLSGVQASEELRRLLEDAIKLHMIGDVPIGAFLSGGIDSTSITGLMNRYVSKPVKTYSIGFEDRYSRLNELKWAKMAAKHLMTDHTEVVITGKEVANEHDNLIHAIDQPSMDGTNTYFISKFTRGGVTVSLSGLGGDELFAGYPHFQRFKRAEIWDKGIKSWKGNFKNRFIDVLSGRLLFDREFMAATPASRHAFIRSLAGEADKLYITSREFRDKCDMHPITDLYMRWLKSELDMVSQVSYIEVNGYMSNTLLRDVDAMSMFHSLEVRPVFLDHVLSEFVFALQPELKLNGQTTKIVLIDALRDILPEPIIHRSKMGFEMPLFDWLAGPLKDMAYTTLSSCYAAAIFSPDFLTRAKGLLLSSRQKDVRLWAYVTLIKWLQSYKCNL